MSKKTDEAKKLIADGLKSIQQGFNKLFEVIDDLENPDAPGGLMADLIERAHSVAVGAGDHRIQCLSEYLWKMREGNYGYSAVSHERPPI